MAGFFRFSAKHSSLLMADLKEHSPTDLHRLVWTQPTAPVRRCETWNSLQKVHLVWSERIWLFLNRSYPMVPHFTHLLELHWKHLQPHQRLKFAQRCMRLEQPFSMLEIWVAKQIGGPYCSTRSSSELALTCIDKRSK